MRHEFFIGVDGGATKTILRLEDAQGRLIGETTGGPTNITRRSAQAVWDEIYAALNPLLAQANLSLFSNNFAFHIGLGLAGCEVPQSYQAFLSIDHPFKTLKLVSDAKVACIGAHGGSDGAIISMGTGVVGFKSCVGLEHKVSGWGFPHDDQGGGAWLGLQAISQTLQCLDQRRPFHALAQAIMQHFAEDRYALVTFANRATSADFGQIAPLVVQLSQAHVPEAIELMVASAQAIDEVYAALLQGHHQPLPCVLYGGLSAAIQPWLGKPLTAQLCDSQASAEVGALMMIKQWVRNCAQQVL